MKILHVITSLSTGGAEKLVTDMVPILRAKGHDVDVCLFDGKDTAFKRQLSKCGCKIFSFSNGGNVYNPLHILKLLRVMRGYDIVHTHNTAPQFFAAFTSIILRTIKFITTEHNTSNRRREWKWYPKFVDRMMYRHYHRIVCISDQAEKNLRIYLNNNGKICKKILTIYNGVDVDNFHNASANKELCESTNRFVVVMVAGFRYQKDQDTLIKAISILPKDSYELWLVGDGERRQILEASVKEQHLEQQVTFLGLRTDVANILKAANVIVMSSHFEGLSLSNIEGMAAGKPFVASDVDGLREVTDGYGILFPHENAEALAEIIRRLHDDKEYYDEVADKCYQRARQFDISKMVKRYLEVYSDIK